MIACLALQTLMSLINQYTHYTLLETLLMQS